MDKPHRVKSDEIELKVTPDNEETSASSNKAPQDASLEPSTTAVLTKTTDPALERIQLLAEKRAREQEFLKSYQAKQKRTRIKFGVVAGSIWIFIVASIYIAFNENQNAAVSLKALQPVTLAASIGERDLAYFAISQFSSADSKKTPELIDRRTKILESSIAEQEKAGRATIFTRLGAEKLLMKYGDRATGLKLGDALIEKYPGLVSNYFWRAKVDFDKGDFTNALDGYNQAGTLLQKSPKAVGQAWDGELAKAVWASIDTGRAADARRFLALFDKYGGDKNDHLALESQLLMSMSNAMDYRELKDTDFWNDELDKRYEQRVDRALEIAKKMALYDVREDNPTGITQDDLYNDTALMLDDHSYVKNRIADTSNAYGYSSTLEARLALAENKPQVALNALARKVRYVWRQIDRIYLKASALQRLHHSKEALTAVDQGLKFYDQSDAETGRYYLPFRIVKAHALFDNNQYEKALAECNEIIAINPHLLEPHLLRMNIYKAQHQSALASKEHQTIESELLANMNMDEKKSKHE